MNKSIQKIFSQVPQTYELINHVLTLGFDIVWRKRAAKIATAGGGNRWLDICSGTGEMVVNLRKLASPKTLVYAADFSLPMLQKIVEKPAAKNISLSFADAANLPFAENTFDLITISFATRNINYSHNNLTKCLSEFHRVLKPGGRFVNLETSQPKNRLTRKFFQRSVSLFVRPVGTLLSGSKIGYDYLSKTIPRFYAADDFAKIIKQAGFSEVSFKQMLFGTAAIHKAIK